MSSEVENLVKEICLRRKALLPTIAQNIQALQEMQNAVRTIQSQVAGASKEEIREKLAKIDFIDAERSLKKAMDINNLAVKRLQRDSINIGVAGKARQGKSQFLQMLTGLTDQQIPTGDTGFCTAARSIIRNSGKNGKSKATVFFMSEEDFLNKKIRYAYVGSSATSISLSPVPKNLDEFINTDLPQPQSQLYGLEQEQFELLTELHKALKAKPQLRSLVGASPKEININEVRSYVTKDKDDDVPYHYVVDHVEIEYPIPTLPDNSNVYDVPGLEDPQVGIRETMVKSITEDADIVFLLRRPDPAGDGWKDTDHNIVGMLAKIYADANINVSDWVQLVMNLDLRPGSNNQNVLAKMEQNPPKGLKPTRCNCGDANDVASMVKNNLQRLASQCEKIDELRINDARNAFNNVKELLKRSVLDPLENGLADLVATQGCFDFDSHLVKFMAALRKPIRQNSQLDIESDIEDILKKDFETSSNCIDLYYKRLGQGQLPPAHFSIFDQDYIGTLCAAGNGSIGALESTVRNQREAIISELRCQLSGCCAKIIACYYDHVLQMLKQNNALSGLFDDVGGQGNACQCIDLALKRLKAGESTEIPSIVRAFEDLKQFSITFEGNILPAISNAKGFEHLDPDKPSQEYLGIQTYITNGLAKQFDKQAEFIFAWLKQVTEDILSQITVTQAAKTTIREIADFIAAAVRANFKTFGFHLVFGKNVEEQWKRFAKNNQAILWKDEFAAAAAKSAVAAQWKDVLGQLKNALA